MGQLIPQRPISYTLIQKKKKKSDFKYGLISELDLFHFGRFISINDGTSNCLMFFESNKFQIKSIFNLNLFRFLK